MDAICRRKHQLPNNERIDVQRPVAQQPGFQKKRGRVGDCLFIWIYNIGHHGLRITIFLGNKVLLMCIEKTSEKVFADQIFAHSRIFFHHTAYLLPQISRRFCANPMTGSSPNWGREKGGPAVPGPWLRPINNGSTMARVGHVCSRPTADFLFIACCSDV